MPTDFALVTFIVLIGIIAALYASVGHGGASGYLAIMALFGVSAAFMRPSALVLNIMVSALATFAFVKAGHFRWRLLWPFGVTSIPFAYWGGTLVIQESAFKILVAATLLLAAIRLFMPQKLFHQSRLFWLTRWRAAPRLDFFLDWLAWAAVFFSLPSYLVRMGHATRSGGGVRAIYIFQFNRRAWWRDQPKR